MIWEALFWAGLAVVVTSYAGYAVWAAALARVRPRPCRAEYLPDDRLPRVTCVLAAADEAAMIGRKLDALAGQDYPADRISIVVVSDASTDGTDTIVAARAAGDPRIRLLRTPARRGKPSALNLARPALDGDVVVFMDVRQAIGPAALRELVAPLADPAVGVVSGDLRVRGDAYWTYEAFVRCCESRSGSMVQVTGSLYALRARDVPVVPADTILDDVFVPLSVALTGRRIVMAERAQSLDVATRSLGHEFQRKVRMLAGLVQICHSVPGCLSPRRNPVWSRFVVHKLSRLACPHALLVMLLASWLAPRWPYRLAFAAALSLALVALAGRLGRPSRLASITQSLLALNLAALWAVPSYYLGRSRVTWARVETDRA
ncbi:MAG TPA: glycosyltransferase [Methylomirabilota bacterium]|jgi:cellulose synthase/poly-beta-1,6-N-acetylglucosamine synthase-like glycosyltransferase|nr:glycosyltransferase [Methylomirabilota bacterium]